MPFGRNKHQGRSGREEVGKKAASTPPSQPRPGQVGQVRHPSMPDLPRPMGELFYECTLFLYSAMTLFWQYWNLYKALWWLPKAHLQYYAKLHLIDPYVLSCVGLILGRRVTWCFFKSIPDALMVEEGESGRMRWAEWVLRMMMLVVVMSSFTVNFAKVLQTHSPYLLLSLVAPVVLIYLFLFYEDMSNGGLGGNPAGKGVWERFNNWLDAETYLVDVAAVRHACSGTPQQSREEVALLAKDLKQRLKQSVFSAFTVAHFAIYVPCYFTPAELYIDWWWVLELGLVVFFTALSLYLAYLFPLQYCNILHQAASHLGRWERVASGDAEPGEWEPREQYGEGSVVTRRGWVYRGVGECVTTEPGSVEEATVEWVGREPLRVLNGLCCLAGGLLAWNFLLLIHSREWQHILTLTSLVPANYIALFFLFKDKVILGRIYYPSQEDLHIR